MVLGALTQSDSAIPDITNNRFISVEVRREVWRRDQGKCVNCGSQQRLEFDHMIPVTMGGASTARNVQLLCEGCNRTKGATLG
jgi:5-methylcytosine-specific restriction endonuclease McrA